MPSLYIHIPFCVKKCRYCGFYSTEYHRDTADLFLAGLERETENEGPQFQDRRFDTLYIGGGTPTCLSTGQLERLFAIVTGRFTRGDDAEITMEANPNTIDDRVIDLLRRSGVNRLSIGVQAFSDGLLRSLGRSHSAAEAVQSVLRARGAGFMNIGIDLMYGIPGQALEDWKETLDRAIELRPAHVSAYCLSLDEGSLFARKAEQGSYVLPDDAAASEMYEQAVERLTSAGFGQYELSNFCLPGLECRHNMNYWERGEYRGLGPGAWSFLGGRRRRTVPDVREYARRLSEGLSITDEEDVPGADQAAVECLLLGMRTARGVDLRRYHDQFGDMALGRLMENMDGPVRAGVVQVDQGQVRLTRSGRLVADEVILDLCR